MRTDRRSKILVALAVAAILAAGFVVYRTLFAEAPPATVDPAVLEADQRLNEDLQRQQPAKTEPAPDTGPRPSRTSGTP